MIWNLFLLKGYKMLIRVALALISLIKGIFTIQCLPAKVIKATLLMVMKIIFVVFFAIMSKKILKMEPIIK